MLPKFDIFSGDFGDKDPLWVEAVEGLGAAYERMEEIAAQKPGPYFVFDCLHHKLLARTDSSARLATPKKDSASAA